MSNIPPRWYCVDVHGLATLCADEANARAEAAENDIAWPRNAPHTAVHLAPVAAAAGAVPEGVDVLRIPAGDNLDPIIVYFEDEAPGQGRMTIACYGDAWTAWWGSMGDRPVRQFVAGCDAGYLSGALLQLCGASRRDRDYAWRVAARVIAMLAAAPPPPAAQDNPVNSGPFGAFYTCPTCSGTGVVTQTAHDKARAAPAVACARIEQCCRCGKRFDATEGQGDGAELTDGRWACSEACWEAAVGPADQPALQPQPAAKPEAAQGDVEALAKAVECIPVPGGDFRDGWPDEDIWRWALRDAAKVIRRLAIAQPATAQPEPHSSIVGKPEDLGGLTGAEMCGGDA